MSRLFLACLVLALIVGCSREESGSTASAPASPREEAAGQETPAASTPTVTASNLFVSERFWPYRVKLSRPWTTPEGRTLKKGTPGVMIRLVDASTARIDFAGLGIHEVPVESTNAVETARLVASGKRHKFGPNVIAALGARVLVSDDPAPRPAGPQSYGSRLVLSVFADPREPGFEALARRVAATELPAKEVLTVFVPQGDGSPLEVNEQLQEAGWSVRFLRPGVFSESFTQGMLREPLSPPALLLTTDEGRVVWEERWQGDQPLGSLEQASRDFLAGAKAGPMAYVGPGG